jgi:hypothetical protein
VKEYSNDWVGNNVVIAIVTLSFVLAVITLPLEIFGG